MARGKSKAAEEVERRLILRKEAVLDISEVQEYYESCRIGLGNELLLCVEEVLDEIEAFPLRYRMLHRTIRRAVLHRFPYGIYYVASDAGVSVLGSDVRPS